MKIYQEQRTIHLGRRLQQKLAALLSPFTLIMYYIHEKIIEYISNFFFVFYKWKWKTYKR